MNINSISTLSFNSRLRESTLQKQVELNNAQYEVASGKKYDLGRQLGTFTSSVVSLQSKISLIDQTKVTNSFAENRLQTMQISIGSIVESSNNFVGQITTELTSDLDQSVLKSIGEATLSSLGSALNVSIKGERVFSGVNTDAVALVDYNGPDGASAKAAVQLAFQTEFGFAINDPLAETITPAALENFIQGAYQALFDDANWESLWSGSSERGVKAKISTSELVETPTTAHNQSFREVTAAAILIVEFSEAAFSSATKDQLANSAISKMAESTSQLGNEQAKIGVLEERIEKANERLDFQSGVLQSQLSEITDVDAYEAALRLNQLSSSLEASYSVTARIQSLSLLNFI